MTFSLIIPSSSSSSIVVQKDSTGFWGVVCNVLSSGLVIGTAVGSGFLNAFPLDALHSARRILH